MLDEHNDYDHIDDYINENMCVHFDTRMKISDFAILWNEYENCFHHNDQKIMELKNFCLDELGKNESKIDSEYRERIKELYIMLVSYIRKHYGIFECNALKRHFDINRPKKDKKGNVIGIYKDIDEGDLKRIMHAKSSADRLHFLLFIITRVRNNMFHGIKNPYDLDSQKDLFIICNNTLCMMLERKEQNVPNR